MWLPRKIQRALTRHGMVGSMGHAGTAVDNAAMESFLGLPQNNVLNRRIWATREQLRITIMTWNERTYHQHRRQHPLSRLTHTEYETTWPNQPLRSRDLNCHLSAQQTPPPSGRLRDYLVVIPETALVVR
jgi:transposase InsO family protein